MACSAVVITLKPFIVKRNVCRVGGIVVGKIIVQQMLFGDIRADMGAIASLISRFTKV